MTLADLWRRRPEMRRRLPRRRSRRSFKGADTGRLLFGWNSAPRNPDSIVLDALRVLRARSRDLYYNSPLVRNFVSMVTSNVAGPKGATLQARATFPDGKLDSVANTAIESAWGRWGRSAYCDIRGRLSWPEMQAQAAAQAAVDGEILARIFTDTDLGDFAFSVQHLDTELLDVSYNETLTGGRYIRMGIEFDSMGRALAYHLLNESDYLVGGSISQKYTRVPAADIIHTFVPGQVGQSRGYPWTATAMQRLKMLDAYQEAALAATLAGASKMGFITTATGDEYQGDDIDSDGAVISDFEPGIIEELPEGQEFTAFDPRYPHEQYSDFVKAVLRDIAGALGVAYEGLSNDREKVNYSSIRAGVLEEREVWKRVQNWFIDGYCRPIYLRWLKMALLTGQITTASGAVLRPDKLDKYTQVVFQPRRWAWVDPKKDMEANILAIQNNVSTVSAVIRDQGADPEEVFTERAKELKRLEELGLMSVGAPAAAASDSTPEGGNNADDEDR